MAGFNRDRIAHPEVRITRVVAIPERIVRVLQKVQVLADCRAAVRFPRRDDLS